MILYMFGGHFSSQSLAKILGYQALLKAPVMSSAKRQHFVPSLLARWTNITTVVFASAVDLPADSVGTFFLGIPTFIVLSLLSSFSRVPRSNSVVHSTNSSSLIGF